MTLRVIGAGLGRTGTLSTKSALEQLGFVRCYHMLEAAMHAGHPAVWRRAADGEAIDWDTLFEGYAATVDWPACVFWEQLAAAYPDAPVLLTVRDPEAWCASFRATIARVLEPPFPPGSEEILEMATETVIGMSFEGTVGDDAHLIGCYERHNDRVRASIDPARLFEFDVGHGWEPLCRFLGRPVPTTPFPNVNDRAFFHAMVEGLRLPASEAP